MVTLAPNVPTQGDPEYLRYSRPIGNVEGNKAGYYLSKGLGDALQEGVSSAEKTIGEYSSNKTYEQLNAAAESEGKRLDVAEASLLNTSENTSPPQPVQNGIKTVASLKERYDNGKISETDYLGDRAKILKDLNAQYPGFRKYIADGAARASGEGSADALIRSRISDYNSIMSRLNEKRNKVLSEAYSTKWSDPAVGAKILDDFQNGRINENQVMFQVFRQRAVDANMEREIKAHEMAKDTREENQWHAEQRADEVARATTENWRMNSEIAAGLGSPDQQEKKALALINNPNDPEALKILQAYQLSIPMYRKQLMKDLQPFAQALGGPAKLQALVDTYAKPFEEQASLWSDPTKVGSLLFAQRHMADAMQRRQEGLISQDELGQQLMGIKAIQNLSGDEAAKFMQNFLATNPTYGDRANKLLQSFKYSAIGTSPESRTPPNVADAIINSYKLNPNPKVADDYINFLSSVKDIKDPNAIRNIAYTYYNPKNTGLIGNWAKNQMDPLSGKPISGQINVLQRMGDKDILDKIKSVGDPKLNGYVKDFLENSISLNVFPELTKDTEQLVKAAEDRLGYDDEHQRFYMKPKKPGDNLRSNPFVQNTIHKLNYVAEVANNLADFVGAKDKNGYLIGLLSANNPTMFSREVPGFPGEINKAIANQALIRQQEAEKKAKARKDLETK